MRSLVLCMLLGSSATIAFSQHSVQVDDGAGRIALIMAPSTGATGIFSYTLPTGGGSLIVSGSGPSSAWLLGGNTLGNLGGSPTQWLGTSTNDDVIMKANGNEKLRLVSGGGVRIAGFGAGVVHSDGSGNLSSSLVTNADVSPTAAIVDTKLATISTAGKVSNSATTATDAATANAIVSRDASNGFSAGRVVIVDQNELRINDGDNSNYVGFGTPINVTTSYTLTFPDAPPSTNGQVLSSTTGGALSWTALPAPAWSLTGNAGTTAGTNFVGTTDVKALHLYVNSGTSNSLILNTNGSIQRDNAGNVRGTNAVDMQFGRTLATQVSSGNYSVISGGKDNRANGLYSAIGGGTENVASGDGAVVAGGGWSGPFAYGNTASGLASSIIGGAGNVASGMASVVAGGGGSAASGDWATVAGGVSNLASGLQSTIVGGGNNVASGQHSFIGGGFVNEVSGSSSVIAGGYGDTVRGDLSAIVGGIGLTLDASADGSVGFLGNNPTLANNMIISAANTAVFGNTDLWLANNDNSPSSLLFYEAESAAGAFPSGTKYVAFKSPAALTATQTYELPLDYPASNGQALVSTTGGAMSWASFPAAGWSLTGNAGTTAGTNFVGTTDDQAVHILVKNGVTINNSFILNNGAGLQREGGDTRGTYSVDLQTSRGVSTQVASGSLSTISGGSNNTASATNATVSGGDANIAAGQYTTVSGGRSNVTDGSGDATIGGGRSNTIGGLSDRTTIAGGYSNTINGVSTSAAIGGGESNAIGSTSSYSVISGGISNGVNSATHAFVGGGLSNGVTGSGNYSSVVGGQSNTITSGTHNIIGGGQTNNINTGTHSGIFSGQSNTNAGTRSLIGAGSGNSIASATGSVIVGGTSNSISNSTNDAILGGQLNSISSTSTHSVIGGGQSNVISASDHSGILSGRDNNVSEDESVIVGGRGLTIGSGAYSSFGFLANAGGSYPMAISDNSVAVFGNTDLWLANNNNSASELRFYEAESGTGAFPSGTKHVAFKSPAALTATQTYTLPLDYPAANGYVLSSTTGGTLSWIAAGGLSGGTTDAITKWTSATTIGNSSITDNASTVAIGSNFSVDVSSGNINTAGEYQRGGSRILDNPGTNNLRVGGFAGHNNTGVSNTYVGASAGAAVSSGSDNVYLGYNSGVQTGPASSSNNVMIGSNVGTFSNGSNNNTFVGYGAAVVHTSGGGNTFLGTNAGTTSTSESNNTLIGGATDIAASVTRATAIGHRAYVSTSDAVVLGAINGVNGSTSDALVGIGTTAPTQKLEVKSGNVLLSNAGTAGQLQLQGTSSGVTTFAAGAQGSTTINYTLPTSAPTVNGHVLSSTTGGVMSWIYIPSTVFSGVTGVVTTNDGDFYVPSGTSSVTSEGLAQVIIPRSGTLKNLYVKLSAAPGAGSPTKSKTVTVRINGVNTSLAVSVSGTSTTNSNTANTVSVSPGDALSLIVNHANTPAGSYISWGFELQ